MEVGQQIRKYRELRGMSKKDLGVAIGKTGGFIGKVESALSSVSLSTLYSMAVALDIPIEYLLHSPRVSEEFIIQNLLNQSSNKLTEKDKKILASIAISIVEN